jgi:EAL domain-containing protein (putative c-di-GMP-specific phosphodiesterase class I)/ActR/RegA family two-component response regulator
VTQVLVVDDEPSVRLLLRDILEMDGYDVCEAADGPAALRMLAGHRPSCVMLDLMMPGMSGLEVLAQIRRNADLAGLPVVMLTAATDDETTWAGWSAGADYYLPKPFDVEHLLKWVGVMVTGTPSPDQLDDVDMVLKPLDSTSWDGAVPNADVFRLALGESEPPAPRGMTQPARVETTPPAPTAGMWREESDAPLSDEVERALRASQIWVAYQPIVALDGGSVVGVEALARWRHPQRGDLAPSEFVPLVEKAGLGDELGRKILVESARQVTEWNAGRTERGLLPLLLNVNVSSRQLAGTQFIRQLPEMLATTGLAPELLVLEVGEPTLVALSSESLAALQQITAAGVRLSLDDFSAADVSTSYLRSFPVAFVKVDRAFVRGIGENPSDDAAVSKILSMSRRFGRTTVAEGVETKRQAEWLKGMGCEYAQGFYFAFPASAAHTRESILPDLDAESPTAHRDHSIFAPDPSAVRDTKARV